MQRAVAINLLSDSRFPYNFVKAEKKRKNGHVIYASMIVSVVAVPKF